MKTTLMTHNAETGEFVCYANNEEVLRLSEPDFEKACTISAAIQDAYKKGRLMGGLFMQQALEKQMDEINRA